MKVLANLLFACLLPMPQTPHTPISAPAYPASSLPIGATIITLLLVIAGSVGLVLLQAPLNQESQDPRSQASISDGEVSVTTTPNTSTKLTVNQEAKVDIQLNTQGKDIKELELVFNVISGATDQVILQTYSTYSLEVIKQEVEETSDGFLVSFKAKPANNAPYFTNSSPLTVISLVFTPNQSGTFKLAFDTDKSKAATDNGDRLKTIGNLEYTIQSPTSTGRACNETCGNNGDCQANHRCSEGRCRLVTNVSSSTCANSGSKDRVCNAECTDNNQCANDFVCSSNRCRRADNAQSAICALSSASQQEEMRKNCNQPCTDNRGCSVNHACHQGFCRLATNPSSTSCSSVKQPTVSQSYYPSTGGTQGQKGEEISVSPSPKVTSSARPSLRPSPISTASATVSARPTPTLVPYIAPSPLPEAATNIQGFISRIGSSLARLTQNASSLFTYFLLGAGGLILAIALLLLVSRLLRRDPSSTTATKAQKSQSYETDLQKKIDQLKQGNPIPAVSPVLAGAPVPKPLVTMPSVAPVIPVAVPKAGFPPAQPVTSTQPVSTPPAVTQARSIVSTPVNPPQLPPRTTLASASRPASNLPASNAPRPLTQSLNPQAVVPALPLDQVFPQAQAVRPAQPVPVPVPTPKASSILERIKQRGITTPVTNQPREDQK